MHSSLKTLESGNLKFLQEGKFIKKSSDVDQRKLDLGIFMMWLHLQFQSYVYMYIPTKVEE
jgi:hypothetical protein